MTTDNLPRTVRRGVALLLVPMVVLVLQFDTYLRHRANLVDSTLVEVSQPVGYGALAGLVLYLAGSVLLQLAARSQ